jgi:Peptidase family S41/Tricorn protease C1 domain
MTNPIIGRCRLLLRRRSGRRLSLLAAAIVMIAACKGNSGQPTAPTGSTPTDITAQFEQMWATFDRTYSYFDYKRIDWNALKAEFSPRVAGLTQNEFVLLVQNMLARLHDQHVVLTSGNTTLRTYTPDYFVNWDNSVWQQYLARGGAQVRNGAVSAVFAGVPYIAIQSWNPTRVNVSDLDAFLDAFRDRPALILDVRMNPGGNDQPAFDFAGRFTTSTTTSGFVQFRNGPGHSDFTPRQARTFSPRGSFQFTRPVLLLIGRFCASSNESFIAALQQLPHVTLIGDTTGGATANPQTFLLGGGWSYSVSRWIEYTAGGQVIEDQGIAPSVPIRASAADFQSGRDPVLDYAIARAAQTITSAR